MFAPTMDLALTPDDRRILASMLRSTTLGAGLVRRARVVLALADGETYAAIGAAHGVTDKYIALWKRRVTEGGILALGDLPRSGRPNRLDPRLEAKILARTHQPPPAPLTHWTTRRMAALIGVSHTTVAKVWQRAGLQPHRLERYLTSDDPDFETKAADVIGLYLAPPTNAVVFSVDEKTAIQALDRLDPVLPLSPGRAERHGFEYRRTGTCSLYAAINVATGAVEGMTATRHTSAQFLRFLDQVIATQSPRRAIHLIADNLSAHKTPAVTAWLAAHPRVTLHFTPTYSSWLNQIEIWFAKIERDLIARGIFTSTADLRRKLMQYIRLHNKTCQPIRWAYNNPKHRIRAG
ncbi:MAG: IS630 family transposase [Gemmatimonadota bacterium]|nr:IS630 family transposase [Gemmatimonadota bacterium]